MGWIDKNELPIRAASRELLEETGYKTLIKPKKLMIFHPDPGRIEKKIYCFYTDRIKRISKKEFMKHKKYLFILSTAISII